MYNFIIHTLLILLFSFSLLFPQTEEKTIGLVVPIRTAEEDSLTKIKLNETIQNWEIFLTQNLFNYKVIYDDELDQDLRDDFELLIFPSVRILEEYEFESIEDYVNEGGNLLIEKEFGVEDGDSETKNYFYKLTGVESPTTLSQKENVRTELKNFEPFVDYLKYPDSYSLNLNAKIYNVKKTSGIVPLSQITIDGQNHITSFYQAKDEAKILWIGFDKNDLTGGYEELKSFDIFLKNSVNWLTGEPLVWISYFPGNYDGIIFLVNLLKESSDDLPKILTLSDNELINQNIFLPLTFKFKNHTFSERLLLNQTGLLLDHFELLDLNKEEIQDSLSRFNTILKTSNKNLTGVKILENTFLKEDIKLVQNSGFDFLVTADYKLIDLNNTEIQTKISLNKITGSDNFQQNSSKLFVFEMVNNYKSSIDSSNQNVQKIFINAENNRLLVSTFEEYLIWLQSRTGIEIDIEKDVKKKFYTISVYNHSDEEISQLKLWLSFDEKIFNSTLENTITPLIKSEIEDRYFIIINEIKKKKKINLFISYEDEKRNNQYDK